MNDFLESSIKLALFVVFTYTNLQYIHAVFTFASVNHSEMIYLSFWKWNAHIYFKEQLSLYILIFSHLIIYIICLLES